MLKILSVPWPIKVKYSAEWLFCLGALVLLSPLMLLIALAVKLTSQGPVLYKSERLGYKGEPFKLLKFRSLQHNCPMVVDDNFKTVVQKRDPRLTLIGAFLRIGFDELPQLINVLKGDITLIGPRPDALWMKKHYNEILSIRLEMLPGISGLAIVCNGRHLTVEENYYIDIWYIQNYSLKLDLLIAFLTPLYVFGWKNVGERIRKKILTEYAYLLKEQGLRFVPDSI